VSNKEKEQCRPVIWGFFPFPPFPFFPLPYSPLPLVQLRGLGSTVSSAALHFGDILRTGNVYGGNVFVPLVGTKL